MATTTAASAYPLPAERNLILASLLALAAAAWALLIWQDAVADEEMSLTMGMGAPLFLAIWVAMMVAIMFPTAAPMILMFARVHNQRRAKGQNFVPTWIFAGAYILVWSATGVIAYGLAVAGDSLADSWDIGGDSAARIGGGLLVAAGVYQLTPLKDTCLGKCRSPIAFIINSWRDGFGGSFRMGFEHAVYCVGCCWLLFLILFPLGMMNVAVLALITALIFAEKSLPLWRHTARLAGAGLMVYGAVVFFVPAALPMAMDDSHMEMMDMQEQSPMGGMDEMDGAEGMPGMDQMD
jgi:predicted metal-binding membrane protein